MFIPTVASVSSARVYGGRVVVCDPFPIPKVLKLPEPDQGARAALDQVARAVRAAEHIPSCGLGRLSPSNYEVV